MDKFTLITPNSNNSATLNLLPDQPMSFRPVQTSTLVVLDFTGSRILYIEENDIKMAT